MDLTNINYAESMGTTGLYACEHILDEMEVLHEPVLYKAKHSIHVAVCFLTFWGVTTKRTNFKEP